MLEDWETGPAYIPVQAPERVYVRFGKWSRTYSQSCNHSTGERESGLSVYRAMLAPGNIVVLDDVVCESLAGQGRLVFPVTGREVGIGSDGEPLLRGVKLLAYAIDFASVPEAVKL